MRGERAARLTWSLRRGTKVVRRAKRHLHTQTVADPHTSLPLPSFWLLSLESGEGFGGGVRHLGREAFGYGFAILFVVCPMRSTV